jgi:hypothetical protein
VVTTAARSEALPDIATVVEFVPDYEASVWAGIGAPKATPAEIVEKLNREINAGLADPRMKARLADLGGIVLPGSPSDFGKLIADEAEKWAKVIKFASMPATPAIPGQGRPPPPPELSDREQQILDGLRRVAADKSTWPLLKAYCMHAVLAEDLAAELRRHARRAARRR